jgi:hypothetical protein
MELSKQFEHFKVTNTATKMFSSSQLKKSKLNFAADFVVRGPGNKLFLSDCGGENANCGPNVCEFLLFGEKCGLAPLIRKLMTVSIWAHVEAILEKNLQAHRPDVPSNFYAIEASAFVYARDAEPFIELFEEEVDEAKMANHGTGTIAIQAVCLQLKCKGEYRVNFCAAPDNDGFWGITPPELSDALRGYTLIWNHTGGWHWTAGTSVRGVLDLC